METSEIKPLKFGWRVKMSNPKYIIKEALAPIYNFLVRIKDKFSVKKDDMGASESSVTSSTDQQEGEGEGYEDTERVFQKGQEMVMNEMNLFTILQTI
jgi:cbb3-type cytochrome oxidase cytochrome c subunit